MKSGMKSGTKNFFHDVFGFEELVIGDDKKLKVNESIRGAFKGGSYLIGHRREIKTGELSTPTLLESEEEFKVLLRQFRVSKKVYDVVATGENTVGNAREMHSSPENNGAIFQAASQFNLLEHILPSFGPEHGITCYENDNTQGPAVAMSAVGGLAYRNYLVRIKNGIVSSDEDAKMGQDRDNQIDCLVDVQRIIKNQALKNKIAFDSTLRSRHIPSTIIPNGDCFILYNGYVESNAGNLQILNSLLAGSGGAEFRQDLKNALRVGIHRDVQVTLNNNYANPNFVTQIYASAVGIAYSSLGANETQRKALWEPFAKIVLESAYEHTMLEGLKNNIKKILKGEETKPIMLTKLGGGVFGNDHDWIKKAMSSAIEKAGEYGVPFDVKLVHYGNIQQEYNDGFLERAIGNANAKISRSPAMVSPAMSAQVASVGAPDPSINLAFLKNQGNNVEHREYDGENNYLIKFETAQEASDKSQELAGRGILGKSGNPKNVFIENNLDHESYYLILTDENVSRLREIEIQKNLDYLSRLRLETQFEIDRNGQDNYNIMFDKRDNAEMFSNILANQYGIFGASGNKKFVQTRTNSQGTTEYFLTLTTENISAFKSKKLQLDDRARVLTPDEIQVNPKDNNLNFLQDFYIKIYGENLIVSHEIDQTEKNNYLLMFLGSDLTNPSEEIKQLSNLGIVKKSNGQPKDIIKKGEFSYIVLTDENLEILREKYKERTDFAPPPAPPVPRPMEVASAGRIEEVLDEKDIFLRKKHAGIPDTEFYFEHDIALSSYRLIYSNIDDAIKTNIELRRHGIFLDPPKQTESRAAGAKDEYVVTITDINLASWIRKESIRSEVGGSYAHGVDKGPLIKPEKKSAGGVAGIAGADASEAGRASTRGSAGAGASEAAGQPPALDVAGARTSDVGRTPASVEVVERPSHDSPRGEVMREPSPEVTGVSCFSCFRIGGKEKGPR